MGAQEDWLQKYWRKLTENLEKLPEVELWALHGAIDARSPVYLFPEERPKALASAIVDRLNVLLRNENELRQIREAAGTLKAML